HSIHASGIELEAVLDEGERLAEEATGAHQFTKHVKRLSMTERTSLIQGLYRVALSDGEKSPFEDAFIRHVASLLHVDDISRAKARKAAEAMAAGSD
ncbi:MAG: TerB family tellurite resistance protein, partial [Pseudomonadota bacterium]